MMTPDHFLAHSAFLRFKKGLDNLEQKMKPLAPEMSIECQFELECLGKIARSFFMMANQEIFSAVHSTKRRLGLGESRTN